MFTQLNPPIPLHVLDKGAGHAIGVIDYGAEHHLIWVTALTESGEIWCAPNPRVRMESNWTLGRQSSPAVTRGRLNGASVEVATQPCTCGEELSVVTAGSA